MGFLDAVNHLLNLLLPALGMAVLLPALARVLWWRAWPPVGWWSVVKRVAWVGMAVLVLGLVLLGRDGSMYTYAALVLSSATVVWWMVFRGRA